MINGWVKFYNEQGILEKQSPYQFGRNSGIETRYFEDGKVKSTTSLLDGRKSGRFIEYFDGKKIKIKGNHRYDLREGLWEYFSSQGEVIKQESYSRGKLTASSEN